MPFGLSNAPATFQKFISSLFRNIPNIRYYLDDIIVYSELREQHIQDLKTVFTILDQNDLNIKLQNVNSLRKKLVFRKCHFIQYV